MIARVVRVSGVELALRVDERYVKPLRAVRNALRSKPIAPVRTDVGENGRNGSVASSALAAEVAGTEWYHTMDLGQGVVTPGFFDHRPVLDRYHLAASLAGARVLDVATYNGFWAFEFERRGAAEVVATDIERFADIDMAPARRAAMTDEELTRATGTGFGIAHRALGSRVRREIVDVYDLSPERFGTFDLVMCSDLLLHLTNPIRALQRVRSVTRKSAYIADLYDPYLDRCGPKGLLHYRGGIDDYVWWTFSLSALEAMIVDAGFSKVTMLDRFELVPRTMTSAPPHVVFRADA